MILNGDTYYRCLVDMRTVLSSQQLGVMMRMTDYDEKHPSGDETSEIEIVKCRVCVQEFRYTKIRNVLFIKSLFIAIYLHNSIKSISFAV